VVHDEDRLLPGDGDENKRIERERTFKLNEQIQQILKDIVQWMASDGKTTE